MLFENLCSVPKYYFQISIHNENLNNKKIHFKIYLFLTKGEGYLGAGGGGGSSYKFP